MCVCMYVSMCLSVCLSVYSFLPSGSLTHSLVPDLHPSDLFTHPITHSFKNNLIYAVFNLGICSFRNSFIQKFTNSIVYSIFPNHPVQCLNVHP